MHARLGNVEQAIRYAKRAMTMENTGDMNYRIAGVFAQLSKLDEKYAVPAISYLVRATLKDPAAVMKLNPADPDIEPISKTNEYQQIFAAISNLNNLLKKN